MTDRLSFPIQPTASVIPRRRERLTDRQIVAEREREGGRGGTVTDRQRQTDKERQRQTDKERRTDRQVNQRVSNYTLPGVS